MLPVVYAGGSSSEPVKEIAIEGDPFWEPSGVLVNAGAHEKLMRAAREAASDLVGTEEMWASEEEWLQNIFAHLLCNLVTHLLTAGEWLASDREWMEMRCVAWSLRKLKRQSLIAAAKSRLKAGVSLTVDYQFHSNFHIAVTLRADGQVVLN